MRGGPKVRARDQDNGLAIKKNPMPAGMKIPKPVAGRSSSASPKAMKAISKVGMSQGMSKRGGFTG